MAIVLGAGILAGFVFVIVRAFPAKPPLPETPVATPYEDGNPETESNPSDYTAESYDEEITTENSLDSALYAALAKIGAPKKNLYISNIGEIDGVGGDMLKITARIPSSMQMAMANHMVQRAWESNGGDILDCYESGKKPGRTIVIEAGFGGVLTRKIIISRQGIEPLNSHVVLVIDDFGALPVKDIRGFAKLDIDFTASVLPFEEYTGEVCSFLTEAGIEQIIHMPMEPVSYPSNDPGENAIFVKLPELEIKRRVRKAIEKVPHAVGMNNHMGSKATSDERTMEIFAEALCESGLFFIDSRTSVYSCASKMTKRRGIPTVEQNGNIDLVEDTTEIAARFIELALSSHESDEGKVLVGHARPNTLAAIQRVIPKMDDWGIVFITASEMISRRGEKEEQ